MTTPAVTPPAESAPAAAPAAVETVETPEVSVQERLNHATSEELDTWRRTGDIPAVKVKTSEPPAKPAEPGTASPTGEAKKPDVAPASTKDKDKPSAPAAASPAAQPPKTESRSERRFREITRENRELRERLEAVERRTTSQASPPAEAAGAKPGSPPAAEAAKPEAAKTQAKPKLTDNDPKTGKPFASLQDWSDAVDDWNDKRLEAKLAERLGQAEQSRTQSDQERAAAEEIVRKSQPAMEKYSDFMQVAANPDLPIPPGSVVDAFVRDSDNPGELAYYIGKHPELLEEFYGFVYDATAKTWDYKGWAKGKPDGYSNKVSPIRQVKRLEAIERELSATPAAKPAAEVRPANTPPPKLPPPPPELSGRRAAPVDEAEAALARGDMAGYMRAMNARESKAVRA